MPQPFAHIRRLVLVAMLSSSAPAFAMLQPIDEAPLSGALHTRCRMNADASTDCVHEHTYTILRPSGRELLSKLDWRFAETDSLSIEHAAWSAAGEPARALDESHIDTRMAPNPDQGFLRERQTSLAFPQLRVGSRIRFTVREHTAARPATTESHYIYEQRAKPIRFDKIVAEFEADRPLVWRGDDLHAFRVTQDGHANRIRLELRAAPYYTHYIDEPDDGYVSRFPRLEVSTSLSASDHFSALAKRYDAILSAPLPPAAAQAVAVARARPPAARVVTLMQHINDGYRYLGDWRASERGHIPFPLREIELRGYGDCKDLSILLAAMLRASGIPADPALVQRGVVSPSLLIAGTAAPNHAIVRAEIDGAVWWLDPTNPVFAPAWTMPDLQDRWAIVFGAKRGIYIDHIPLTTAQSSVMAIDQRMRFSGNGHATVNATAEFAGLPALQAGFRDRQLGRSSTDRALCETIAEQHRDCTVQRGPTDFVVAGVYPIGIALTDRHALEKLARGHLYVHRHAATRWLSLEKYRREGQLSDIYLDAPRIRRQHVSMSGGRADVAAQHCQVRSPWFDVDLTAAPTVDGYQYRYEETQKVSWLGHDVINSPAFGAMLKQALDCTTKLRFAVQVDAD